MEDADNYEFLREILPRSFDDITRVVLSLVLELRIRRWLHLEFTAFFFYASPCYYNSISLEIRSLPSLSSFKRATRSFILIHFS